MSEEQKQHEEQPVKENKGGAHIAKSGSNIAKAAEKTASEQDLQGSVRNKYADKMNKKKKKLSKGVRIGIIVAITALFVALGIFLVMKTRNIGDDDTANTTAVATRGMLETYIEGTGTTAAKKREELGRDFKGKIEQVLVAVGDEVSEGDELIVVDPTETREELKTAERELTDAQKAVINAQDVVAKAQSEVSAAQKRLNKLVITAPFSGKLIPATDAEGNSATYRVGQQLSEGEVIGYMVDDSQMVLSLYFSTAYSGDIKSGQKATVSIPSAMSEVSGTVSSVEQAQKVSDEGVKLFKVNLSLKNPGTLVKGMLATASITTSSAGVVYPADSGVLGYNREEAVTVLTGGEIKTLNGIDYYNYKSGATIMQLTSDAAQDDLRIAQQGVTTAQNEVANAQKLVMEKQNRIRELRDLIENSTIKAPIDGVVVNLSATEGQEVSGAESLVVVADLSDIIVNADIMATDVMSVQAGQMATMTMYMPDGSNLEMTGIVDSVALEPTQDNNGGQGSMAVFNAVIAIDPVEGQSFSIGQQVEYRITTASSMDCLIVPSNAIVNTEDGTAVFAKPAEGETFDEAMPLPEGTEGVPPDFVLVPVEVGISDSTNTEILWGIDEGATVFLAIEDMYADMNMGGNMMAVG